MIPSEISARWILHFSASPKPPDTRRQTVRIHTPFFLNVASSVAAVKQIALSQSTLNIDPLK